MSSALIDTPRVTQSEIFTFIGSKRYFFVQALRRPSNTHVLLQLLEVKDGGADGWAKVAYLPLVSVEPSKQANKHLVGSYALSECVIENVEVEATRASPEKLIAQVIESALMCVDAWGLRKVGPISDNAHSDNDVAYLRVQVEMFVASWGLSDPQGAYAYLSPP